MKKALFETVLSQATARIKQDSEKPVDARQLHRFTKKALSKYETATAEEVVERVLETYAKFEKKQN